MPQTLEDKYGGFSLNDMNESTLGSRRNSLGHEPDLLTEESSLKHAISCESVCSESSILPSDLDDDGSMSVGHVCIGLEYERWGGRGIDGEGDLAVSVVEARDLVAPDERPARDTFARCVYLPTFYIL